MPLNKLNLNSEKTPKPIITNSVSLIAPLSNINNNLRPSSPPKLSPTSVSFMGCNIRSIQKKMDSTTTFFKIN